MAAPEIEPLLVEMQSPPFSKLYGKILKTYLGEESPFKRELIDGQETRNLLVHRPGSVQIDPQRANNYVSMVEEAIFHLLSLLNPTDRLVKNANFPRVKT